MKMCTLTPLVIDTICCVKWATQHKTPYVSNYINFSPDNNLCQCNNGVCIILFLLLSLKNILSRMKKPGICRIIFCWQAQAQFTYLRRCKGREDLALFSLLVKLTLAELLRRGRKSYKIRSLAEENFESSYQNCLKSGI